MHTVSALLCFVVVIHWLIFPYPSGLFHWHCGNLTIAPVPAKQPWWIWINTSCEFIMNDCITTTKQSTTKPCAYFLGYTVSLHDLLSISSAIDKPKFRLSNVLLKSTATVPAILPLSKASFHFSVILTIVVWQLYLSLKPERNLGNIVTNYWDICMLKTFSYIFDSFVSTLTALWFSFFSETSLLNRDAISAYLKWALPEGQHLLSGFYLEFHQNPWPS